MSAIAQKLGDFLSLVVATLLDSLPGLLGLVLVLAIFGLAGAAISRDRTPILLVVRGWAVATMLAITLPLAGTSGIAAVLYVMLALAGVGVLRVWKYPLDTRSLMPCIVLGLPLIVLSAMVPSIYWDAYTHWLPNAHYLTETDELISAPLRVGFYSFHPTYPPALAMPAYLASQLSGEFAIGTAQSFCSAILILTLQHAIVAVRTLGQDSNAARGKWSAALLALLAIALFNPTLHDFRYAPTAQSLQYWSALADPTLAVLVLVTLLVIAQQLASHPLGTQGERKPTQIATLLAVGVLLATLKNSGGGFVAVILIATFVVAVTIRLDRLRTTVTLASLAVGSIVASALWHVYLARSLPLADAYGLMDFEQWRLDQLPLLAVACFDVMAASWPFSVLVSLSLVLGVRAMLRRQRDSILTLDLLLALAGLTFLGHAASMAFAYLTFGFEDYEIAGAHSWQRYVGQAGFACCAAVLIAMLSRLPARGLSVESGRARRVLLLAGIAAIAYVPTVLSAAGTVGFYQRARQESRELAVESLTRIPPHSRVAVLAEDWSRIFVQYSSWAEFDAASRPHVITFSDMQSQIDIPVGQGVISTWMQDSSIDCILLLNVIDFAPVINLPAEPDHLWCRSDDDWQTLDLGRQNLHRLGLKAATGLG